jgi:hypothetical protein
MRLARDHDLTDNQTGKLDPAYAAEVEAHTARRERKYEDALRRLESARKRHERAEQQRAIARTARERRAAHEQSIRLWSLVEDRLRELRVLESVMTEIPATRDHRGRSQAKHRS